MTSGCGSAGFAQRVADGGLAYAKSFGDLFVFQTLADHLHNFELSPRQGLGFRIEEGSFGFLPVRLPAFKQLIQQHLVQPSFAAVRLADRLDQ